MSELLTGAAVLLPLSVAAGLDVYLALFFLATAPYLGWARPFPGGLDQLGVVPVLAMAALLYVVELSADRVSGATLAWNVANTAVRPVAAALLALLLFHPVGTPGSVAAALLAAGIAGTVHVTRTGWTLVQTLGRARSSVRLLTSGAEDATVVALLSLALEHALAGGFLALGILGWGVRWAGPYLRAGLFGHRLLWARTWGCLDPPGWREGPELPGWIRDALKGDPREHRTLRGIPAGALALPASPRFVSGWLVSLGGSPRFLRPGGDEPRITRLDDARAREPEARAYHDRVELVSPSGELCAVCVPKNGPGASGLGVAFPGPA